MNFRRVFLSLLEFLLPLHSVDSTPERSRYWRNLPLRRAAKLLAAVFFTLSGIGFFVDLVGSGTYPLWGVLLLAGLSGRRILFDSAGLFSAMLLGYRLFLGFAINEGLAHVRLQTELALAQAIQNTLVPAIVYRGVNVEAYGRTIPSEEVGGDLVDLVASDANVFAYLADVSGHGIPAGVLMGMVKTAVRQGLLFHQSLTELLNGMNRVLPAVKEPHMYATLAGLQFHGAGEAEYTAAGHPPLLHYRRSENDVVRRGMEQFPLGLFLSATYASGRVPCGPGDLFALVTDGIVETTDAQEEEFGLDRLAQLVSRLAARPLG